MFRKFSSPPISHFRLSIRLALAFLMFFLSMAPASSRGADLIYVSMGNNTIVTYDIGLASASAVEASAQVFSSQGMNGSYALTFDRSGNLYVANYGGNSITRYDSSGNLSTFVSSVNGPVGLAFDSNGYLYAANSDNNVITKYDSSGNFSGTFVPTGQGLDGPRGLAFDAAGNLYAANINANTITRYDSSGNRIGSNFVSSNQGLSYPYGMAFDAAGYLYVANQGANTITRYDSSGNRIGTNFVTTGSQPMGVAFDSFGYLYVANVLSNTISKYDNTGVLQFSWSTGTHEPRFLAVKTSNVPEPSTYILGGIASGLMAWVAHRRKGIRIKPEKASQ